MSERDLMGGIKDGLELASEGGYVGDEPHDGSFDGDDSDPGEENSGYNYSSPGNPKKRHTL